MRKTLYKLAKTKKIQVHTMWVEGDTIFTEYGVLDGKTQIASVVSNPKNVGKTNATTAEQQALLEMESKLQKKRDKGYFDTIEEAKTTEVFLPMLAASKGKYRFPLDVQPKMDGVRALRRNGVLTSRGGKVYDVAHISDLTSHIPYVLDGEIYIHGTHLQDIVSLAKKPKDGSDLLEYWIYDLYIPDMSWEERNDVLAQIALDHILSDGDPRIVFVPSFRAETEEDLEQGHSANIKLGYEGSIIRHLDGFYELGKRSRDLLKKKDFMESEYEIIGYKDGKGKFVGCVIWRCVTEEGLEFDCTPRGTITQKKEWYLNAESYIGKMITVRYPNFTKDGIPQHNVGIAIRDYE